MLGQRGDTIIEVLLAFTVFSLVSVGTMTVMAQGVNTSQRALEITQVRQQIESQAESLRAAQRAHTAQQSPTSTQWEQFALASTLENSDRFTDTATCPSEAWINDARTFVMDPRTATYVATPGWYKDTSSADATAAFSQLTTIGAAVRSYGMWIERTYEPPAADASIPNAYSFTIRACWNSAGLSVPLQIETIVRLYEPNS